MIAGCATPEPDALQITLPPPKETELPSVRRVTQRPDFAGQAPNASADAVSLVAQSPPQSHSTRANPILPGPLAWKPSATGRSRSLSPSSSWRYIVQRGARHAGGRTSQRVAFLRRVRAGFHLRRGHMAQSSVHVRAPLQGRRAPELDQSRHPRHGVPDPISNGSIGRTEKQRWCFTL